MSTASLFPFMFSKLWHDCFLYRDLRSSKSALFDGLDNLEEGGLRASSSFSHDVKDHDNGKAIESLHDRVAFLKRVSSVKEDLHICFIDNLQLVKYYIYKRLLSFRVLVNDLVNKFRCLKFIGICL